MFKKAWNIIIDGATKEEMKEEVKKVGYTLLQIALTPAFLILRIYDWIWSYDYSEHFAFLFNDEEDKDE